jgi:hypothetical protein
VRGERLGDEAPGESGGGEADRHVDEEDPLPRERAGEDPAEQQAEGAAAGRDRTPDAERLRALGALGERRGDDRQRRRRDQRAAEALEAAGGDQHPGAGGEAVEQRGGREDEHAGDEQPAPADEVGGAAAEQQEPAEHQRVGVDHPLQVRRRELEVVLDRRQRDVHDRGVEDDHELREADQHQDEPRVDLVRRRWLRSRGRPGMLGD